MIKMMFLPFFIVVLINIINAYSEYVEISIPDLKVPKTITGNKFLSAALDTSNIATNFKDFDMSNKKLINATSLINLGYLRIGGNMADRLHFVEKVSFPKKTVNNLLSFNYSCIYDELNDCEQQDFPNFTMSGLQWTKLNNFAKSIGAKILFDLNCLIRNKDGSWNSKNAEELISFSAKHNFDIDWQLGNEPNAFKHVFNYAVNATQLAKDFSVLRKILNNYELYKNSLIVGPDVTRPQTDRPASVKYLKEFLNAIEDENILNAIGFHQYYLNGRTATINDFLNPYTFDLLESQIKTVKEIVENSKLKQTPIWLTETSSAYGGGAKGLSNTFVASFLWLDKLGLAAKYGIKTVVRQSIFKDSYALIDNNYNPSPDWWVSLFYNMGIKNEVLECNFKGPATLRIYCHCSQSSSYITVFGINISNTTITIKVNKNNKDMNTAFIFTSVDSLISTNVLVNNAFLKLGEDGSFPEVPPIFMMGLQPLTLPPYSLFFWDIHDKMEACIEPMVTFL